MRVDVYQVVKAVYDKTDLSKLDAENARYLEKLELQYRRDGLALSEEKREKLKELKKRLSDLSIDFQKNINEDKTQVTFTKEELAGMPDDFIGGLNKTEDEKAYIVTMKYPDLFPMLNRAQHERVREVMDVTNSTRCKENVKILEEAIQIRDQMAKLLGYANHAAYVLEVRMAKETPKVKSFLLDLADRLRPLAQRELQVLQDLKKSEKAARNEAYDGKFHSWDFRYYHRRLLESEYEVDDEKIKEYFSLSTVTEGMLDLYQHVLNLKFTEVKQPPVWHADVQMYEVRDGQSNDIVGFFYLDLFPRDGKYTHAGEFVLFLHGDDCNNDLFYFSSFSFLVSLLWSTAWL